MVLETVWVIRIIKLYRRGWSGKAEQKYNYIVTHVDVYAWYEAMQNNVATGKCSNEIGFDKEDGFHGQLK